MLRSSHVELDLSPMAMEEVFLGDVITLGKL
jgi:hypothetical protein